MDKEETHKAILIAWTTAGVLDPVEYAHNGDYHEQMYRLIQLAVDAVEPQIDSAFYRGRNTARLIR